MRRGDEEKGSPENSIDGGGTQEDSDEPYPATGRSAEQRGVEEAGHDGR